ncbi:ImmA/IrrE family metallo-endopeptidase [Shouchella hunanensis]|uniref:ImmA/IrrE family metallo-endopeptidase n=1 Tax=Shouchella hunanensis TaxID=766894 RepID=A0ABY7W2S6_9BACI|nr:ImmA/IrrE family metallo-endopeptidase [Shouchella hunanensis]WDF02973.1 ImmA/IrrE family metallo-endopeptidase [Shouchella hunanensis]
MYTAQPISRKEIQTYVGEMREALNLENKEYFPILDFLELIIPQLFKDFDYEILEDSEMPREYGVTLIEDGKIFYRESVYVNALKGVGRDRFTIAHELGHYFLHRDGKVSLARSERKVKAYEDPEWQANEFASELLAPLSLIKGLNADEISERFGVSKEMAKIQLSKIK